MTITTGAAGKSAIERACDLTGGQSGLARVFGIRPQAVQKWVTSGIVPPKRAMRIEIATGGAVKASELCPEAFPEHQSA